MTAQKIWLDCGDVGRLYPTAYFNIYRLLHVLMLFHSFDVWVFFFTSKESDKEKSCSKNSSKLDYYYKCVKSYRVLFHVVILFSFSVGSVCGPQCQRQHCVVLPIWTHGEDPARAWRLVQLPLQIHGGKEYEWNTLIINFLGGTEISSEHCSCVLCTVLLLQWCLDPGMTMWPTGGRRNRLMQTSTTCSMKTWLRYF